MARMGMDVDQVESIGHQLKNAASNINNLITSIDHLVNEALANWEGKDATDFHGWWNSQHKPALQSAEQAVDGLGQSALNNAAAQRSVSGN